MCGIAGFYGSVGQESDSVIKRMLTRIEHRGPDQSGSYTSENIVLGSVRLSILDLSGGTMPISSNNGKYWIVFNGEIFNYVELKEDLVEKGYVFQTTSDTEVIVNLYQEYGNDFINQLNGQFAIAIWDKDREMLFLGRDRVGIRPLFYTQSAKSFIFSSTKFFSRLVSSRISFFSSLYLIALSKRLITDSVIAPLSRLIGGILVGWKS